MPKGMGHKAEMGMKRKGRKGYRASGALKGSKGTKYSGAMKKGGKKGY